MGHCRRRHIPIHPDMSCTRTHRARAEGGEHPHVVGPGFGWVVVCSAAAAAAYRAAYLRGLEETRGDVEQSLHGKVR